MCTYAGRGLLGYGGGGGCGGGMGTVSFYGTEGAHATPHGGRGGWQHSVIETGKHRLLAFTLFSFYSTNARF